MSRSKKPIAPRVHPQEESYEENSTEDEITQDMADGSHEEEPSTKKSAGGSSVSSNRNKQFRCTICNYVTNVKARYTKHVKYHSMPSIKCDYCDFKTPYKWNLDRHYKNHNGEGSLSCPLCNFTCDIKQSLTVHIQNHHAVLPPNIADLIKQSLGYADATPSSIEDSKEEYQSQSPTASSYTPAKTSGAIKRRNSSPGRSIGVTGGASICATGRTPILTITRTSSSPSPKKLRSDSGPKMLVSSLRYNCRSCNYTTLSEGDLNRHILRAHQSRRISASSAPSSKRMPSLIPIKPQCVRSSAANASQRKPSQSSPKAHEGSSSSITINGSLVKHEDAVPVGDSCASELRRGENKSDSFEEKLAFLECLALKPNKKANNISEKDEEERSSARESQSPSLQAPRSISASPKRTPTSKGSFISRRRTSFFDKLTQKLAANSNNTTTVCKVEVCEDDDSHNNEGHSSHSSTKVNSNSTRCQYCRHRCKSSVDLISHLGQCPVAKSHLVDTTTSKGEDKKEARMSNYLNHTEEGMDDKSRIFVWNDTSSSKMEEERSNERNQPLGVEEDLVGYETEPGVGSIHYEGEDQQSLEHNRNQDELAVTTSRNVYKCPQNACGFWATTASRFHVHVVGHYNLKPFECSQCSYRSNWRWDITKHIRLKTLRDPNHAKAKVLLTHESGERNYRKYDRYLVSMDVKYSADSKLPDCSTVASKRMDVECSSPGSGVSTPMTSPVTILGKASAAAGGSQVTKLQMPKLTKAPVMNYCGGGVSESNETKEKARVGSFPPSLKPISISPVSVSNAPGSSRSFVEKKMLAGCQIEITPHQAFDKDSKRRSPKIVELKSVDKHVQQVACNNEVSTKPRKNPLWKCKKCPFKHPVKEVVLVHLRHNHKPCRKGLDEQGSPNSQNNIVISSVDASGKRTEQSFEKLCGSGMTNEVLKCSQCSFMTKELYLFEDHAAEHHNARNTAAFPCAYCASVFASRKEFLQHMKMHGSDANLSPEDQSALTITPEEIHTKPRGAGGTMYKKYRCLECPYVTDSKGQFLYHKQFHIPRESLFKCPKCSYNVSHKHLLHQHIRVHGSGLEHMLQDHEIAGGDDETMLQSSVVASYESEEEDNLPAGNHPTVLVWKNGRPFRMFRCHLCPQVFGKLSDLQDHEEEHNSDAGSNGDEAINLSLKKRRTSSPAGNFSNSSLLKVNYNNSVGNSLSAEASDLHVSPKSVLYFCDECPARFFYEKELRIHHTFHVKSSEFKCQLCSYSARQQVPHLMSHMKVHGSEYQAKTQHLLAKYPKASSIDLDIQSELQLFTPSISITPTSSKGSKERGGNASTEGLYVGSGHGSRSKPDASIHCDKCPAKFNTMASFIQHRNNHGRRTMHTCRYCDYSADSGNNLTLHEILHAGSEITIEPEVAPILHNTSRRKTINLNSLKNEDIDQQSFVFHGDEILDSEAYEGNPEFIYPTYVKNGRVKSKRYKCNKCPSAFEKRDQYRVHIGLHGSDQRYKCTVCDYAVTYYANYIQHLKKHENQLNVDPELLIVKPFSKMKNEASVALGSSPAEKAEVQNDSGLEDIPGETAEDGSNHKRLFRCPSCPFTALHYSQYQDHLSHHLKLVPDQSQTDPSSHKCIFCDFTSSKKSLLRDHVRQHFQRSTNGKARNPESFMFAEDTEIFMKHGTGKEEKVFCEKENYNERRKSNESEGHCSIITISGKSNGGSIIDMRRGLPVSMLNALDDSE